MRYFVMFKTGWWSLEFAMTCTDYKLCLALAGTGNLECSMFCSSLVKIAGHVTSDFSWL